MPFNLSSPWTWALGAAALGFLTGGKRKRVMRAALFGVGGLLVGPRLAQALPFGRAS